MENSIFLDKSLEYAVSPFPALLWPCHLWSRHSNGQIHGNEIVCSLGVALFVTNLVDAGVQAGYRKIWLISSKIYRVFLAMKDVLTINLLAME